MPCYRDFTLAVCRSLGFASATADSTPSSGSPSLRLRASWRLASPATATRRLIMQKARRHRLNGGSDRLKAHGFRNSFTPLVGVLFTFPSRYSYTIGLAGVFSLAGWSRRIRTGFLVPRATQEAAGPGSTLRVRGCHPLRPAFPGRSPRMPRAVARPLLPRARPEGRRPVWALPRSLATTGGITVVFSSWGY